MQMVRLITVSLISSLLGCSQALAATDDNAAYSALLDFASISSKTINSAGCRVTATIDFGGIVSKLNVFKEAWLNRDYSTDFYGQRRKQVFIYIIVKRYPELKPKAYSITRSRHRFAPFPSTLNTMITTARLKT
jgi:hypothetical protein